MATGGTKASRGSVVTLREITVDILDEILALSVREDQNRFVATNAKSLAQAHFYEEAWYRAIYADDVPIGFIMLHDGNPHDDPKKKHTYFLWRFMIDARYQKMGFGRRAMDLLIEHVSSRPDAKELFTSFQPGDGSPEGFYLHLGFEHTGKMHDSEIELRLRL